MTKPKIAIIGAGISGVTIANNLKDFAQVKIFEKARGVGGRMSSRYYEKFSFDHGAQYFTAIGNEFQKFLSPFILSGDVVPWQGKVIDLEEGKITPKCWFMTHFVAAPNMNSLCKKIAKELDISCTVEVDQITKNNEGLWNLKNKNGEDLGNFDFVISTAPPAQTSKIFGQYFTIKEIVLQPCFAMMLGFEVKWENDWIFASVKNNPIKLIAVNSSKFGRDNSLTSLVIQTEENWSLENVNSPPEEITKILLENFNNLTHINQEASYVSLHRWLYALTNDKEKGEIFFDPANALAATGDWTSSSNIEDVWLSAERLSGLIKQFYE